MSKTEEIAREKLNALGIKVVDYRIERHTLLGRRIEGLPETCPHVSSDEFAPLKIVPGVIINWETGLIECKKCLLPVERMVQECSGCEELFWGYTGTGEYTGCIYCYGLL